MQIEIFFMRSCGGDLAEWFECLTANEKVQQSLIQSRQSPSLIGIWEAADEAVLNTVREKTFEIFASQFFTFILYYTIFLLKIYCLKERITGVWTRTKPFEK
jgi:hypothetical protein